ncbi:GNAT family N-acetyltransferase [Staphylococcus massiliensis]|uniref:Spermine/spermidine acetyltransferase blt n=1 Tax=Staphylococcus massiliensis S46 TaxID=1229783 RepID=K9B065_9STAP|nr:GNAT family N-acetyltransferase [Staphylococcus massiliensis]EKU47185.1 spermine/spermidine acetyltransferase blt [Staphylococcus massiliensis S46]PNZ99835.1 N-acetyltransferase [Staphylococcus massiliensis CCUG 55927]
MNYQKQFENITIRTFSEDYREALEAFELSERQRVYSSLPKEVLDEALNDENRIANIAINEQGEVIGFFVLHQFYQHEGYETPHEVIYIRSLSINEAYQGKGYGTKIMMNLPNYVKDVYPEFNHLYLVVDAENEGAWNLYERSGFMHAATKESGPIGKERLYYLDLDTKYVSSLRIQVNQSTSRDHLTIIDLMLDQEKVGFIALETNRDRIIIRAIEVESDRRDSGIAENALRQLATFVRKTFDKTSVIECTLFGIRNQFRPLLEKSNFVTVDANDDFTMFEKYINY